MLAKKEVDGNILGKAELAKSHVKPAALSAIVRIAPEWCWLKSSALWQPGGPVELEASKLHCFGTAPDNDVLKEDFKVALHTVCHYIDSAGNAGNKEGVLDSVANSPAL